jgi:hypothetical protein
MERRYGKSSDLSYLVGLSRFWSLSVKSSSVFGPSISSISVSIIQYLRVIELINVSKKCGLFRTGCPVYASSRSNFHILLKKGLKKTLCRQVSRIGADLSDKIRYIPYKRGLELYVGQITRPRLCTFTNHLLIHRNLVHWDIAFSTIS